MITIHEAGLNAWFILNFLSLWYQLHGWVIPDPAGMKNHTPLERYSKPIERGGLSIVNLEFQKLGFSQVDRGVRWPVRWPRYRFTCQGGPKLPRLPWHWWNRWRGDCESSAEWETLRLVCLVSICQNSVNLWLVFKLIAFRTFRSIPMCVKQCHKPPMTGHGLYNL